MSKIDLSNYMLQTGQVQIRELTRAKYRIETVVTRAMLEEMAAPEKVIKDLQESMRDQVVQRLTLNIWGEDLNPTVHVVYPRDWWEAFKGRWFPAWLLRRYPVQYTDEVVQFRAEYPDFKPVLPPKQAVCTIRSLVERSDDETGRGPGRYPPPKPMENP